MAKGSATKPELVLPEVRIAEESSRGRYQARIDSCPTLAQILYERLHVIVVSHVLAFHVYLLAVVT